MVAIGLVGRAVRARAQRPGDRLGDRGEHGRLPRRERRLPARGPVRWPRRDVRAHSLRMFVGDEVDDAGCFNSPLLYLPGLEDPLYLGRLRTAKLPFVVGQAAWEDEMIADTRATEELPRGEPGG